MAALFFAKEKKLSKTLHNWSVAKDPDTLHDLRVEIKKLLAIIRFLRQFYPEKNLKKRRDEVKRVFLELGKLREYHIIEQWLQRYQFGLIQKTCFSQEDTRAFSEELSEKSDSYDKCLKRCCRQIEKVIAGTQEVQIESYITGLGTQIKKSIRKDLAAAEWHPLRKNIKQYLYASNWVSASANRQAENQLAGFHALEEAIGKWHDLEMIRVTLMQCQYYLSKDLPGQLAFTRASARLNSSIQYRKRQVTALLRKNSRGYRLSNR